MNDRTHASVPWWYRHVRSWRTRMWIETGVWIPASRADSNLAPTTNAVAASIIESSSNAAPGSLAGKLTIGEV